MLKHSNEKEQDSTLVRNYNIQTSAVFFWRPEGGDFKRTSADVDQNAILSR